jgi:hypothetical protein
VFIILGYKDLIALTVMEILIFGLAAVLLCTVVSAYPAQSLDRHDKNCTVTGNGVRVFVLSDITNEPDDTMSFIRMLTHSDMYTVEGLVATTSWWLNDTTSPESMKNIINTYETVRSNLQSHTDGQFPTASFLLPLVKSGPKTYGSFAIDALESGGQISEGAELLIKAVDASDEKLFVMAWGGTNTLAEALWSARKSRSLKDLSNFISKLSVYTISDQDDTGFWIRNQFPNLRYILSIHGWNQYGQATWEGMALDDNGGPDMSVVSDAWLASNIQIGPLGRLYPDVEYTMEGDSPSLLFTFQNGLNVPEHPEYGSWGGRYAAVTLGQQLYANTQDTVVGQDGKEHSTTQATVWRWRLAYQNEFASRMQWTLTARDSNSSAKTSHPPIISLNGTCDTLPYEIEGRPGSNITLDATASYDQDTGHSKSLNVTWLKYTDVTFSPSNSVGTWNVTIPAEGDGLVATVHLPSQPEACEKVYGGGAKAQQYVCQIYQLILQVTGSGPGAFPMTRYKRIVIKMTPHGQHP